MANRTSSTRRLAPQKSTPKTAKPRRKTPLVIPVIPGYQEITRDPYHLSV